MSSTDRFAAGPACHLPDTAVGGVALAAVPPALPRLPFSGNHAGAACTFIYPAVGVVAAGGAVAVAVEPPVLSDDVLLLVGVGGEGVSALPIPWHGRDGQVHSCRLRIWLVLTVFRNHAAAVVEEGQVRGPRLRSISILQPGVVTADPVAGAKSSCDEAHQRDSRTEPKQLVADREVRGDDNVSDDLPLVAPRDGVPGEPHGGEDVQDCVHSVRAQEFYLRGHSCELETILTRGCRVPPEFISEYFLQDRILYLSILRNVVKSLMKTVRTAGIREQ